MPPTTPAFHSLHNPLPWNSFPYHLSSATASSWEYAWPSRSLRICPPTGFSSCGSSLTGNCLVKSPEEYFSHSLSAGLLPYVFSTPPYCGDGLARCCKRSFSLLAPWFL